MKFLEFRPALRFAVAGCALLLGGWGLSGFMQGKSVNRLVDLIDGNPSIAISFELEVAKANELLHKLREDLARETTIRASWPGELVEANVWLVVVKDWETMTAFSSVPGLEEVAKSSSKLEDQNYRVTHTISQFGKVILVVVAYMVPSFDTWAFDCVSKDFARTLISDPNEPESKLRACIEDALKDYMP